MEMECDLVVDCINGSLPFEKQWKEEIENHLASCWECQELMELMNELPELANPQMFSNGMKARILAMVFKEGTDSGSSSLGYSI